MYEYVGTTWYNFFDSESFSEATLKKPPQLGKPRLQDTHIFPVVMSLSDDVQQKRK